MPPVGHRARGDYNGDGTSDVAIYRSSSGLWAVRCVTRVYFGGGDDDPVPRDYNGDGTTDIGIFRYSSGLWAIRSVTRSYFGGSVDEAAPADYNGDGSCDIAIFRYTSGLWAVRSLTRAYFGGGSDWPLAGDYRGERDGGDRHLPAHLRPLGDPVLEPLLFRRRCRRSDLR